MKARKGDIFRLTMIKQYPNAPKWTNEDTLTYLGYDRKSKAYCFWSEEQNRFCTMEYHNGLFQREYRDYMDWTYEDWQQIGNIYKPLKDKKDLFIGLEASN